ncbi:L,D-transpeptidase family protein [Dongia sedimenti]|uniref:L,D-transpeptidase family protein n=1 Tax=Dongia sedimenti TaxID=3064282 RepID=A0ABU0YMZ5_9PROT|nr:L,D-transpeptidase family protein [Rhodospirillaceae bacterium R-7]
MTDLVIEPASHGATQGWARLGDLQWRCALGRSGISADKVEGDGATPSGRFPIRRLFYRPDRVREIACVFPVQPMSPGDGWCDAPGDPAYNRLIIRPYPAQHETLWREDALYDLVLVIGHNDDPVVPGKGSAVFLHLAHPDYQPTEGCVAFARADFIRLLAAIDRDTHVVISA